MFDLIIRNGTVIDGTGAERFRADIAVNGDRIVAVASSIPDKAKKEIDATGLYVTPGFMDTHSHADKIVLFHNTSYNILLQGITFQFMGQCGDSPVPYSANLMGAYEKTLSTEELSALKEKVSSPTRFIEEAEKQNFGVNISFFLGHQAMRASIMGYKADDPNQEEMQSMKSLLEEALSAGYWGMSTGLVYVPSVYAKTEELVELSRVLAKHKAVYASHVRGEGNCVVSSVAEAIKIGHESGAQVQISHLKVMGEHNRGTSKTLLKMIDEANAQGDKVTADQYPFEASSAPLICQMPPKYLEGGNEQALTTIQDKAKRKEIEWSIFNEVEEFESAFYFSGYDGTIIAEAPYTPEHIGKTLVELAEEQGKTPFDAYCDLLIANHANAQGVYINQNIEDICRIMTHPKVFCGCDWAELPVYHEAEEIGGAHPRCIGTFPKRLETIRNYGLCSAEEAICSITGRVAETFGIEDRGVVAEGKFADLCIIDYNSIHCNADYVHPFRRNDGILHVIVNGKVAVENGALTGELGGRVVKHNEQ